MIYVACENEEAGMRRVICKDGQTTPGHTALTLERETATLVFKAVPAEICANCGEAYVAEEVSCQILAAAELAARSHAEVDVSQFARALTWRNPVCGLAFVLDRSGAV
jgi:YgiT-type zinc finger domain-containing protein